MDNQELPRVGARVAIPEDDKVLLGVRKGSQRPNWRLPRQRVT
jgi:hypothetical protein